MAKRTKKKEITEFDLSGYGSWACHNCQSTYDNHEVREFNQKWLNGRVFCKDCGWYVRPYYHDPYDGGPNPHYLEKESDSLFDMV